MLKSFIFKHTYAPAKMLLLSSSSLPFSFTPISGKQTQTHKYELKHPGIPRFFFRFLQHFLFMQDRKNNL